MDWRRERGKDIVRPIALRNTIRPPTSPGITLLSRVHTSTFDADADLLLRYQRGDAAAVEELLRFNARLVGRHARPSSRLIVLQQRLLPHLLGLLLHAGEQVRAQLPSFLQGGLDGGVPRGYGCAPPRGFCCRQNSSRRASSAIA